ncbi:MAG: DnaJ C-terminal domain-containing protein [Rectinemataceae bacterium]
MDFKDYYKILGVARTAKKEELKKQYRKLARQYHPDVNTTDKNAAARFSEITEAYDVLTDDEKRQKYDAFGSDWEQHQNSGEADHFDWSKYASQGSAQAGNANQNWEDLFGKDSATSDFFKFIFGQGIHGQGGVGLSRKGQDLTAELSISLEEAYVGGAKILSVGGQKIRLKLKPGTWDRQTIQIPGKGAAGINGGTNGDLYITFLLQPHSEYRLDGVDLFRDIPVSIYPAILGSTLEIQTIAGKFEIKIPPETKNGTVFRLKGKGFPIYDKPGSYGDLFLRVVVQLPERLTLQEKKLFQDLAALRTEKSKEEK